MSVVMLHLPIHLMVPYCQCAYKLINIIRGVVMLYMLVLKMLLEKCVVLLMLGMVSRVHTPAARHRTYCRTCHSLCPHKRLMRKRCSYAPLPLLALLAAAHACSPATDQCLSLTMALLGHPGY